MSYVCSTYTSQCGEWPHIQMSLSLFLVLLCVLDQRQFPSDIGYKIWKIWNVFIRILTRGRTQHRDIVPWRHMRWPTPQNRISIISEVVYRISIPSLHHKPVITDWSQNNKPPTYTVHRTVFQFQHTRTHTKWPIYYQITIRYRITIIITLRST